jgi:hypothetical protein
MQTNPKTPKGPDGRAIEADAVVERLLAGANPCDRRKSRDLAVLAALTRPRGAWFGKAEIVRIVAKDRDLVLFVKIGVPGLAYEDGVKTHRDWLVAIRVGEHYPVEKPTVTFAQRVPWHPNVFDSRFRAPSCIRADLRAFSDAGHGSCCFARSGEWTSLIRCDLAFLVFFLSRMLVGAFWAEDAALNPAARDEYLRRRSELPLGKPLPPPTGAAETGAPEVPPAGGAARDADIEWEA